MQQGPVLKEVAFVRDEMANIVLGHRTARAYVRWSKRARSPGGRRDSSALRTIRRSRFGARTRLGRADPLPGLVEHARALDSVRDGAHPWFGSRCAVAAGRDASPHPRRADHPRSGAAEDRVPSHGLDAGQRYFVREEEVPRSGVRLTSRLHRARWTDGRVVVWLGSAAQVGRGEAASGLRFDQAEATHPAP